MPAADLAIPAFGDRNHIPIDHRFRLIRGRKATDASAHDGAQLPEACRIAATPAHPSGSTQPVAWLRTRPSWTRAVSSRSSTTKSYRTGRCLRRPPGEGRQASNRHSRVERVLADEKSRMGLFIGTVGISRGRRHTSLVAKYKNSFRTAQIAKPTYHARQNPLPPSVRMRDWLHVITVTIGLIIDR